MIHIATVENEPHLLMIAQHGKAQHMEALRHIHLLAENLSVIDSATIVVCIQRVHLLIILCWRLMKLFSTLSVAMSGRGVAKKEGIFTALYLGLIVNLK
jgi:hypothetical protein